MSTKHFSATAAILTSVSRTGSSVTAIAESTHDQGAMAALLSELIADLTRESAA